MENYIDKIVFSFRQLNLVYVLLAILGAFILEKFWAAEAGHSWRNRFFNIRHTVLYLSIALLFQPFLGYCVSWIVQSVGGGWISVQFNTSYPRLNHLLNAIAFLAVFDFFYYWFHRIQHTLPILWSQHKLHHSEVELNATTTYRHHWLEEPLRMVFILIPMSIIFKVNPIAGGLIGLVLGLAGYFIHSNLRLNMSFLQALVVGPQAHRIHHSNQRQHMDRNFAAVFPVYDILFGTYYSPAIGEYPPTGLHNGKRPTSVLNGMMWPLLDWWTGDWKKGWKLSPRKVTLNYLLITSLTIFLSLMTFLFVRAASTVVEAPKSLVPLAINDTVSFTANGRGKVYLSDGWSNPEEGLTWNTDTSAKIRFSVEGPGKAGKLYLTLWPYLNSIAKEQKIELIVNKVTLEKRTVIIAEPVTFTLDISKSLVSSNEVEIQFLFPDAKSPAEFGLSADIRKLAFGLLQMRLKSDVQ